MLKKYFNTPITWGAYWKFCGIMCIPSIIYFVAWFKFPEQFNAFFEKVAEKIYHFEES